MTRIAKLFRDGRSHAVRLPSDYRFEGSEVFVRRDPATGDVILSRRPESWEDFFELMGFLLSPHPPLHCGESSAAPKQWHSHRIGVKAEGAPPAVEMRGNFHRI
jgi:antitoxin VapB